jgi:hypothetical protein
MDPITQFFRAVEATAIAVSDVCKLLITSEGQQLMKMNRENVTAFREWLDETGKSVGEFFKLAFKVKP